MRLFVAILLSEEMKDALIAAQNGLYDQGIRGNFTPEENLHLTLAFIGEYPDAQIVLDALAGVSFTPFELSLGALGCFGDLWWAGLGESAALASVVRRVRRVLAEHGVPFDKKRFSAHITLLRRASGKPTGLQLPPASMSVGSIFLMRSDRGRHGMIYTPLGAVEAR